MSVSLCLSLSVCLCLSVCLSLSLYLSNITIMDWCKDRIFAFMYSIYMHGTLIQCSTAPFLTLTTNPFCTPTTSLLPPIYIYILLALNTSRHPSLYLISYKRSCSNTHQLYPNTKEYTSLYHVITPARVETHVCFGLNCICGIIV